ncbi:MAG: hypothetical protein JXB00_03250 [Bacteroidales bacterium]|nr:hypothetical protein [Bacteroidales bacterium]
MKKVAIPVVDGKLSEYFGGCNHYEIFSVDAGFVKSEEIEKRPEISIAKIPGWIAGKGVTDIITHRIDKRIINDFIPYGINLFIGIAVNSTHRLIEDYLSGNLRSDEKIISEIMA